ncbi:thioredoxin domain-containing protein [Spiractinospora alimapuensis]|uniref:DsbA family protein n=1 Tax=Spiractinospora alimapuensis TaxID=2820884 RepID=UPI001F223174|nr:thioredoxin domain-containing protein [Spiractinospora alimapuensis]QVQ52330.1 thioredoxin domain-containing protein [Spiractinospora alimapuensis]
MNKNLGITLGLLGAVIVALGVLLVLNNRTSPAPTGDPDADTAGGPAVDTELLVRDDSHYLDRVEDSPVTVVEFLDFECEACRAQFPIMEQIREDYEGEINVVLRYFPLPGHANSEPAAAAVEAAAQQDALEEMYARMFETQGEWGERQESQAEVFEGFAEDIGLDMEEFTETVEAPETLARIRSDFDDGQELGVRGTPTIYVNGTQTQSMPSYDALASLIDQELAG